ncbi:Uncharacterised protein [Mycobacteroides abscessus subsp. abscessus]|nr:Uncharacterised protein [Mycobacteroides abscessus subsp. abscessus]
MHVQWQRPDAENSVDYRSRVRGRSDAEIITSFVTDVRDKPTTRERALVESALRAVVGEPEQVASCEPLALFEIDAPADGHRVAESA